MSDLQELLPYIDYYFPNEEEARKLTDLAEPDEIADAFLANGLKNIVLKLGSRGCLIKNREERLIVPAYAGTKCVDTTGAGDNFAAGFITALIEGKALYDCGRFANAAASVCVEHVGAVTGVTDRSMVDARFR